MEEIRPPIVTNFFKSVSSFFSLIKKTNPKVEDRAIFNFIEKNHLLCRETVTSFRSNLKKNLKLMTLSSVIAGKSEAEIRTRIDKMNLVVSVIALQKELKKNTIKES